MTSRAGKWPGGRRDELAVAVVAGVDRVDHRPDIPVKTAAVSRIAVAKADDTVHAMTVSAAAIASAAELLRLEKLARKKTRK